MKKFNFKFFGNVLLTSFCIWIIVLFGLKQPYSFDDAQKDVQSFTLTNRGEFRIDEINGIKTHGEFVRVQNGKLYDVILNLEDEIVTSEEFSFNSELKDVAFVLDYNDQTQSLEMYRSFDYIKGIHSASLGAIMVIALQCIYYISFMIQLVSKTEEEESDSFQLKISERLMNVGRTFYGTALMLLGFGFLISLLYNPLNLIYEKTDTMIIVMAVSVIVSILAWSLYVVLSVQHYRFDFDKSGLRVYHKRKLLFESDYENLIVEERISQTTGVHDAYTNRTVILKSRDIKTRAVEMNLIFLPPARYEALLNRLHNLALGRDNDDMSVELILNEAQFFARKNYSKNIVKYSLILVITSILIIFGLAVLTELNPLFYMLIILIVVISFTIIVTTLTAKRPKLIKIKADLGGITINDTLYETSILKKITMSRPRTGSGAICLLTLKYQGGSVTYNILMFYKSLSYEEPYRHIYRAIRKNYPDIRFFKIWCW